MPPAAASLPGLLPSSTHQRHVFVSLSIHADQHMRHVLSRCAVIIAAKAFLTPGLASTPVGRSSVGSCVACCTSSSSTDRSFSSSSSLTPSILKSSSSSEEEEEEEARWLSRRSSNPSSFSPTSSRASAFALCALRSSARASAAFSLAAVSSAAPRQVSTCETMSDGWKDLKHNGQSAKNDDACVSFFVSFFASGGSTFPFLVFPSLDPCSSSPASRFLDAAPKMDATLF